MKPKLSKHTLLLHAGDYAKLQEKFPEQGAALIIRTILRNYLARDERPVDLSKLKMEKLPDV